MIKELANKDKNLEMKIRNGQCIGLQERYEVHFEVFIALMIGKDVLHSNSLPFPHGQFLFLPIPIPKQSFNR